MQTQDQGFTVDHPIVGQNTGTWDRNVFKINEPGEAVQNNGLNKLGGLTNGRTALVRSENLRSLPWLNEKLQDFNTVNTETKETFQCLVKERYKGLGGLDIIGTNKTAASGLESFRILSLAGYNTLAVLPVYLNVDGVNIGGGIASYTGPTGEKIISACQIRANGADGFVAGVFLLTLLSDAATMLYKLYYNNGATNTLISSVDATLFDAAPHFNAWYNGGRYIVQSPIFDANGPQYAWSTTTPTTAASWAQLSYSAWLSGFVNSTNTALALFGSERTTAGRTQVGANITISAGGVLTETALVPEVGYTQGANAFNGPGFYTSLFTDTAGGASIQAMTGNLGANVNTQATGAGITETVLPDSVGYIQYRPSDYPTRPDIFIKIKTANKKSAYIAVSGSAVDPGAVISEYGGFDLTMLPSFWYENVADVRGILAFCYATGKNEFEIIELQITTSVEVYWSDSRIEYDVFQMNFGASNNILDMTSNTLLENYGSFVRCGVAYQTQFSTGVGANTINIQPGNKYSTGVYLGAYTGVASTALPNRTRWLEYWPGIYAYHSAYTNGAGREYVPGDTLDYSVAGTFDMTLSYIDTVHLDNPTAAFVQNDNLPIPVGCKIDFGIISLPTGVAVQTKLQSDFDGSPYGYCGYLLATFLETTLQPFVVQGNAYGFDGKNIYTIASTDAQIETPQYLLQADGISYICSDKDGAYFYRNYDFMVLYFDGGRNFQPVTNLTGLLGNYSSATTAIKLPPARAYGNSAQNRAGIYNQNTGDVWMRLSYLGGNLGRWLRLNNGLITIHAFTVTNAANDFYLIDRAFSPLFITTPVQTMFYFAYSGTTTIQTLNYQSPYYGVEEGHYVRVTKYVFMLKVTDPATTDLVVTFKWFTYDASGTETYTFLQNTYTSTNGYTYIEYIPTQQVGHGVSIGLSSTKEVYILGITGHYGQPELALTVNQNPSTS